MTAVRVVWAQDRIPAGPSVFLAGPTPRSKSVRSWRADAFFALRDAWAGPETLNVLIPEPKDGVWAEEYHDQVEWETTGLDTATVIMFWIPRDVRAMPGFTTNVEFGLYARSGRVVLGAPPDCPNPERNRYLVWVARRYGVPVFETLTETAAGAVALTLNPNDGPDGGPCHCHIEEPHRPEPRHRTNKEN